MVLLHDCQDISQILIMTVRSDVYEYTVRYKLQIIKNVITKMKAEEGYTLI